MKLQAEDTTMQTTQIGQYVLLTEEGDSIRKKTAAQIAKIMFAKAKDFEAFDCKLRQKKLHHSRIDKHTKKPYSKIISYVIVPDFLVQLLKLKRRDPLEVAIRKPDS